MIHFHHHPCLLLYKIYTKMSKNSTHSRSRSASPKKQKENNTTVDRKRDEEDKDKDRKLPTQLQVEVVWKQQTPRFKDALKKKEMKDMMCDIMSDLLKIDGIKSSQFKEQCSAK